MAFTDSASSEEAGLRQTAMYVAVVLVEIAIVTALWVFGRYFGS